MKSSFWGVTITIFGVLSIALIYFFQSVTNTDEQNYTLLKETTEGAMIDAFDMAYYRRTGDIRIDEEKFVENFFRRFAENVSLAKTYKIDIYDINEEPPKVSIKVSSSEVSGLTGQVITFDISNQIDAILEAKK